MDKLRKALPPLDTLIFFEAVMRNGVFTAASSELYVSQAAVSKRIRLLESWLGTPLFERGARSLVPTPAGVKLAEPVAMALDYLQTSLEGIKSPVKPAVRIAANNAVSVFWLFPRIKAFAFSEASCPVETVVSDDPAALLASDHDLAIIYAAAPPEGWEGAKLMDEDLAPVLSPECVESFGQNPQSQILLDYERYAPDWINWDVWAKRHSTSPLARLPRKICETYSQSIGRAIAGEGIALASCALLQDELASGALVALDEERYNTGKGYFLVKRSGRSDHKQVTEFANFLARVNK
ncbi:LysR family transcriptional regulator [uncultured Roseovarius sp.]|uniref:LysR family transcriptional regulator n=1 Tax=uncultured Roseovarius sp. TaxID=293344 RepID=UPI0025CE7C8D|nr:LysR family transcriptional regulator [uncultured Roseovarius sp.]